MAASSIRAGAAFIEISERGLQATATKLKAFGDSFQKVGQQVGTAGKTLFAWGAGAAGAIGIASKMFGDAGSKLSLLSESTGLSAKYLQEMGFAADASGSSLQSFSSLAGSVQERFQRLAQLADTDAVGIFAQMGMNINKLQRMNPEDRINAIVAAVSNLKNVEDQKKVLEELGAVDLLPMVRRGVVGINQLKNEAQSLGLVLSQDTLAAAKKSKEEFFRLGAVAKNIGIQIGAAANPIVEGFVNALKNAGQVVTQFIEEHQGLVISIVEGVGVMLIAGASLMALGKGMEVAGVATKVLSLGFGVASTAVSLLGGALGVVGTILGAIFSPIGLIVAAVVGVGIAVGKATGLFNGLGETIGKAFSYIKSVFGDTWGKVSAALQDGNLLAAAGAVWDGIKQVAGDALQYLGDKFGWLMEYGSAAWQWLSDTAIATWDVIASAATSFWDWLVGQYESNKEEFAKWGQYAMDIVQNIWDFSVQAWTAIKDFAVATWNTISEYITSAWKVIGPWVDWAIKKVSGFVTGCLDVFSLLTTNFGMTWDLFVKSTAYGLSRAMDYVKGYFVSLKDGFMGVFAAIGKAFKAALTGGDWKAAFLDEITAAMDKIKNNFNESDRSKLLGKDVNDQAAKMAAEREKKRKAREDAKEPATEKPTSQDDLAKMLGLEMPKPGATGLDKAATAFDKYIKTKSDKKEDAKPPAGQGGLAMQGSTSMGTFSGFALRGLSGNPTLTKLEEIRQAILKNGGTEEDIPIAFGGVGRWG